MEQCFNSNILFVIGGLMLIVRWPNSFIH